MVVNDANGRAMKVKPGGFANVVAINEPLFHACVKGGIGWSLGGVITAADAADHVIFYLENTSDVDLEIHGIFLSSAIAGLMVIETGRIYASGGVAKSINQFRTDSGKIQSVLAYMSNGITLTGTATEVIWKRVPADNLLDMMGEEGVMILAPQTKMAIRFDADSGTPQIALTMMIHGEEPWEYED